MRNTDPWTDILTPEEQAAFTAYTLMGIVRPSERNGYRMFELYYRSGRLYTRANTRRWALQVASWLAERP